MTPEEIKGSAIQANGRFWKILSAYPLHAKEKQQLLEAAEESLMHWMQYPDHTPLQEQRGTYLVAKAHLHLRNCEQARINAERCLSLTREHRALMADFDIAYACELMAKLEKHCGNDRAFISHRDDATELGKSISDPQDRDLFFRDLALPY